MAKQERIEQAAVCREIGARTGGDILIGVVGPVRTGKSTLIKQFMEKLVLPAIGPEDAKLRARDELPQSAAGRTIMTTEPKFIPEAAVPLALEGGGECSIRLIDCVGYMVEGAMGHEENDKPRMVKSPWFDEEIPFDLAAETGTRKVIRDHSTIGIVVTTDGTISEIPRENYIPAEKRVIDELEALGKPFVILLNSTHPDAPETRAMAAEMEESYGRTVLPVSCLDLDEAQLGEILQKVLYEFPVRELDFALPRWVTMLDKGHWLQTEVYTAAMQLSEKISRMKDISDSGRAALDCEAVENAALSGMNLADGVVRITVLLKPEVFYKVLSEQTGLEIGDEAGLMPCIIELAKAKRAYEKIRSAMEQVEATGYGIVMPSIDELSLEQPEIVRQGGRYGVRLEASAPSIHMMKAVIHTELSPIVGTEKQSEDLVQSLLQDFEDDPVRLWESNIFGKSLHELVNDGLQNKLLHMPQEARGRLQETLERVINEGCTGLSCILFLFFGQFGNEHLVNFIALQNELLFYHLSAQPVGCADVQTEQLAVQSLHLTAHGAMAIGLFADAGAVLGFLARPGLAAQHGGDRLFPHTAGQVVGQLLRHFPALVGDGVPVAVHRHELLPGDVVQAGADLKIIYQSLFHQGVFDLRPCDRPGVLDKITQQQSYLGAVGQPTGTHTGGKSIVGGHCYSHLPCSIVLTIV